MKKPFKKLLHDWHFWLLLAGTICMIIAEVIDRDFISLLWEIMLFISLSINYMQGYLINDAIEHIDKQNKLLDSAEDIIHDQIELIKELEDKLNSKEK